MSAGRRRLVLWVVIGSLVAAGLYAAFRPRPVPVDLVSVVHGDLVVTVDEEGETRVREVFVLSAPVAGRVLRIEPEVGDEVIANESILAEIEPVDPTFLDLRGEAQAQAAVMAAESARTLAQAEVDEASAELDFARAELDRARGLIVDNTISQRELDAAEREYKTANAAYATKLAALQVRNFELERARAELISPNERRSRQADCECVPIFAPVDGVILQVLHESEGVVPAGEPLLEIGDARDLEIVVDLLSADAVKAAPGQRVIIHGWGGTAPLEGRVQRVEPFGFTKVSALGIEEQRVNVIIDITSPPEEWLRLGHGYQVDLQIVLSEGTGILTVPLTALFREEGQWALFVDVQGRARRRHVELGQRNGLEAEITAGLEPGERIVLHPSDRVIDGVRIMPRDI